MWWSRSDAGSTRLSVVWLSGWCWCYLFVVSKASGDIGYQVPARRVRLVASSALSLTICATVHDIRDICTTYDVIYHDVSCVRSLANSLQLPRDLDTLASFLVFKEYFCYVRVWSLVIRCKSTKYYTHPYGKSYVHDCYTINSSSSLGAKLNSWGLMMTK